MTAEPGRLASLVLGLLLLASILGLLSFKVGVVLGVLRKGLSGVPPAALLVPLSLLLSALVMAPVAERSLVVMKAEWNKAGDPLLPMMTQGVVPLREFLLSVTPTADRKTLLSLAQSTRPKAQRAEVVDTDLAVLLPAFALSELRLACQIAFLLLLPFLLLDLLVSILLSGLSLFGLPAQVVSLPFKLLLFVLCDGWHLLTKGLLLPYGGTG